MKVKQLRELLLGMDGNRDVLLKEGGVHQHGVLLVQVHTDAIVLVAAESKDQEAKGEYLATVTVDR